RLEVRKFRLTTRARIGKHRLRKRNAARRTPRHPPHRRHSLDGAIAKRRCPPVPSVQPENVERRPGAERSRRRQQSRACLLRGQLGAVYAIPGGAPGERAAAKEFQDVPPDTASSDPMPTKRE